MDNQAYYFVNHTRKEFDFFTKHVSICKALSEALSKNTGWNESDDIRIASEDYKSTACLEYLDSLRYNISKRKN